MRLPRVCVIPGNNAKKRVETMADYWLDVFFKPSVNFNRVRRATGASTLAKSTRWLFNGAAFFYPVL